MIYLAAIIAFLVGYNIGLSRGEIKGALEVTAAGDEALKEATRQMHEGLAKLAAEEVNNIIHEDAEEQQARIRKLVDIHNRLKLYCGGSQTIH